LLKIVKVSQIFMTLQTETMSNQINVTVLIENCAAAGLAGEHGLAYLIGKADSKVVFDTGQTPAFIDNANRLSIDLSDISAVVLSHGHYDHTGGLAALLSSIKDKVDLYMHPCAERERYSIRDGVARSIGMPAAAREAIRNSSRISQIIGTVEPTEVADSLYVTGPIPRRTSFEDVGGPFFLDTRGEEADDILDDQSMYFQTDRGLVVITGCAHAGIINTLNYITEVTGDSNIHAVIGGLHLVNASAQRVEKTIDELNRMQVEHIYAGHCTGTNAMQQLEQNFSGNLHQLGTGTVMKF